LGFATLRQKAAATSGKQGVVRKAAKPKVFANGDRFGFTLRGLKFKVFKEDLFLKEKFSPRTLYD